MSAAANSVISDKAVIDKLSEQLKTNLENTVSEMGIVATVSKAFQQGKYIYIY
jgi:bifunctional pyridoxal-dependent enzyme with beta-cystathionase and maltose regulon repressor activities